jgi:hypothetical protein
MTESAEQVTSFVLNHMKIADMRPTETLKKHDYVRVKDREWLTGMIMKFDADKRLAWISGLDGWWYLKDLEKIHLVSREFAKNAKETKPIMDLSEINNPLYPDFFGFTAADAMNRSMQELIDDTF